MDAIALVDQVASVLRRHIKLGDRLTVGLSGGLDSVTLLSLLSKLRDRLHFDLAAHHVNHQISPNAAPWATFCSDLCAAMAIPFSQTVIDPLRPTGEGLEAAARAARYASFVKLDTDFVVLGHHQDDQAETMLLRLLRGAGVKGMAGMAECSRAPTREVEEKTTPLRLLRPLLHLPRSALAAFALEEKLQWIDDESNANVGFTRNYLRADVLPRIDARFPAYRSVLDRAAAHFAEAGHLLDTLAALDVKDGMSDGKIAVHILSELDQMRAKNALRYFLGRSHLQMPDHDRLGEMLRQVTGARDDAMVCVVHDGIELRRFRGWLYVVPPSAAPSPDFQLNWGGEKNWVIPALNGTMVFQEANGAGIAQTALLQGGVSIRVRQGGERLRLSENRPRQTLKNLLQMAAVPPWRRERLPLLYIGDHLAYAPGVGVDVRFQSRPNEEGMTVMWMPDFGIESHRHTVANSSP
ncbi:MAG TPA: tRNA lysidine(34) synthetase TilS [Burkholderiales bacterium]|nr:tRNA lysidine(34) synthetase TilS [Burkholderiales bacterium]